MNRPTKAPRAPKNTKEEVKPRGSRQDPRADPVTSPPPPMSSRPPLSTPPRGRDQPEPTRTSAPRPTAERPEDLERQLEGRVRAEAALRDTSVAQLRRITALEQEILVFERKVADLEERLAEKEGAQADLARVKMEHAAKVADLERALEKITQENETLKKSLERTEDLALRERAAKEDLAKQVVSLEAILEKIKVLMT